MKNRFGEDWHSSSSLFRLATVGPMILLIGELHILFTQLDNKSWRMR